MRKIVRVPDHMVDSSKPLALAVVEDILPEQFQQAANTCIRIAEGRDVAWKERTLMLSNFISVDGKRLSPEEWDGLLHGDMPVMTEFCRLAAHWIEHLCTEMRKARPL